MNETPHPDMERILFSAQELAARTRDLAAEISRDYAGREVHLIGVLRGAVPFIADLARSLAVPATVDYLAVSSYGAGSTSSGVVRITKDLDDDIESRHVLIIEDILDSGRTLDYLVSMLRRRRPAGLEVCTLLDKPGARQTDLQPKYVGFSCPDCFVVGYGLDYAQRYRELPYIGELKRDVYSGR
jgi:hypoxanthine phosphoribosyltransferase